MQKTDIPRIAYDRSLAKYGQVKQGILDFVKTRNLQEGYRFPSADELAVIFGVNRLTANRAMEELAREGVIERIPGVGSLLKKLPQKESIGILIPSLLLMEKETNRKEWFVLQQVMQGIMKGLAEKRILWEIVELSSLQNTSAKIKTIIEKNINGILFLNSFRPKPEKALLTALRNKKIPFVIAYNINGIYGYPSVFVDKTAGFRKALRHLAEHGHRKIALVDRFPMDDSKTIPLFYSEVLEEHGLEIKKEFLWNEQEVSLIKEKIDQTGITGIFFTRDLIALEAMEVLGKSDIKVGRDIGIVGYDNIIESLHCKPALTTVEPHRAMAGYYAVKMLLSEMNKAPVETIRLVPDLVIRESCGCKK
jgi:DNA-binding LacI/PurR family transcriptional regulator